MTTVDGTMSRAQRDYSAFGLRVRSSIALPFRPSSTTRGEPDVVVRFGATPASLPAPVVKRRFWEAAPGAFLLTIDDVARYHVTDGRRVLIEPCGGTHHDIGVFFVGSVFAALLQQRSVVPLHASAIATGAGAVLLGGSSGVGKSSLLAALSKRGHAMLADDVTGVIVDRSRPVALPAFPDIRLWADAVDALDWRTRTGRRVRESIEKFVLPAERFRNEPLGIRAYFALRTGDGFAVEKASSRAAMDLLFTHTYRRHFLWALGGQEAHFSTVERIVKHVPVFRMMRAASPLLLDELADRIEACLATLP